MFLALLLLCLRDGRIGIEGRGRGWVGLGGGWWREGGVGCER